MVEGDVSLASVANDLGFDGRELNAMLAELPIGDDPLENNPISVGDGFLGMEMWKGNRVELFHISYPTREPMRMGSGRGIY